MLGQFEVGGSKCALRDHSEVPGVTGAGLSLGALAGSKVGERVMGHLDSLPPQGSTGVVTTRDGCMMGGHRSVLTPAPSPGFGWYPFGLS